jgi:CDP-glycerol glycerophosphotransferase (TagB/SpsB family)
MLKFVRFIGYQLYRFTPKRDIAVIWGWPDHEDSVIAVEQALQDAAVDKVVILMTDPSDVPPWKLGSKTVCVKKDTLRGRWWFCQARYVFFTHRCFMHKFPPNVVSVNIWHGMPLKRIGWMLEGNKGIESDYVLATSPFWAEIMDRSMKPKQPSLSIGLPRNDRLFSDRAIILQKLGLDPEQRLLAWLPTYRKSVRGEFRNDGRGYGNAFEIPDIDPVKLNDYCRQHQVSLILKPHPMAIEPELKSFSHLWIVDDSWLHQKSLSLYELLGASDALISDISSVVIDYLLLDRPIIHAFADCEAYRNSRGFSMEPIEDYFMGPVATCSSELLQAIDQVLAGNDPEAAKRKHMRNLSHQDGDDQATKRLLNTLKLQ